MQMFMLLWVSPDEGLHASACQTAKLITLISSFMFTIYAVSYAMSLCLKLPAWLPGVG